MQHVDNNNIVLTRETAPCYNKTPEMYLPGVHAAAFALSVVWRQSGFDSYGRSFGGDR